MNKPPAFQFYADDFLAGTFDMTAEEVGAYIRLLCHQWNRGAVPSGGPRLAIMTGASESAIEHVKSKFKAGEDGMLRNERLERERAKQQEYRDGKAKSGRAGADKRWQKDGAPNGSAIVSPLANGCQTDGEGHGEGMAKNGSPSPSPSPIPSPDPVAGEREAFFPEIPNWEAVKAYADMTGLAEWKARDWFDEMEGVGWVDYRGRKICKWQSVMDRVRVQWESDGRPMKKPAFKKFTENGERARSPMELNAIIKAKTELAAKIRTRFCSDTAMDSTWSDASKREEWFRLKKEIKELTTQLSNMA